MKKHVERHSRHVMMRVTHYCHERLLAVKSRMVQEIMESPEKYPAYAGRFLTFSDVINLLIERVADGEATSYRD